MMSMPTSRRSGSAAAFVAAVALMIGACGRESPTSPTPPAGPSPPPGQGSLRAELQGDPESPQGATWTYRGTADGVAVDLQGILLKPRGSGPFPAIVISHGAGGNANGYGRAIASEMVQWGLVCIATNYTHAGGVPRGAPGTVLEPGASQPNIVRAHVAYEILRGLGYVDPARVAAHGHSMGAFVTSALVAAYPDRFRAASHSAGGLRLVDAVAAAPSEAQLRGLRTPYQLHHGDADFVVPLVMDERFAAMFRSSGVVSELHVYAGAAHEDVARSAVVLGRIRAWYASLGMF
jgi:dienelactone hydrolase